MRNTDKKNAGDMLDPDYRKELERQQKERDGEIIWKYKTEDKVTDFIIQNDKLYYSCKNGYFHIYKIANRGLKHFF
jgi:hypothetical protein